MPSVEGQPEGQRQRGGEGERHGHPTLTATPLLQSTGHIPDAQGLGFRARRSAPGTAIGLPMRWGGGGGGLRGQLIGIDGSPTSRVWV